MMILALEFSSSIRSVAVLSSGADVGATKVLARATDETAAERGPVAVIERALVQAGIKPDQIERIAVGLGPGSYTGIRSAIAVAKGWQLARATPLVGISSVECLAAQAGAAGLRGRVKIVIDAQRNEVYLASYEITSHESGGRTSLSAGERGILPGKGTGQDAPATGRLETYPTTLVVHGPNAFQKETVVSNEQRELEPLRLASIAEITGLGKDSPDQLGNAPATLQSADFVVGPEATRWFPHGKELIPDAAMLGTLAAGRKDLPAARELEPIYLRPVSFVKAPPARIVPPL